MSAAGALPSLRSLAEAGDPNVRYQKLVDRAHSVPPMPRFIFGDFTADLARRYAGELVWRDVGLFTARGIDVFGECVLSRAGALLLCDGIDLHAGILPAMLLRQRGVLSPRRLREETGPCVLLLGPGHGIYGHWLVDFLPKLWVVQRAGHELGSLRFLVPTDTPDFGLQWLELLGIEPARWIRYDPMFDIVRPETLLVPEMVRTASRTSPVFAVAVRFLSERLASHAGALPPSPFGPRVFLSRARAGRAARTLVNRDAVEALAGRASFALVHPEQLTLAEQVAVFRDARQIMGEYGSALHGSIFSPPGTVVCALRGHLSPIAGFLQSAIGAALGQPTGYVFGTTDPHDPLERFSVPQDALQLCFDLVFSTVPLADPAGRL